MKNDKKNWIGSLPIVTTVLNITLFEALPNLGSEETTLTYPMCVGAVGFICFMLFLRSTFSMRSTERYLKNAPRITAILLILTVLDILTLKTGILKMPVFPWPDKLLNQIIADRTVLLDCAKNSLILLFKGYLTGILLGLITGITAGRFVSIRYWIDPLIRFLLPIPAITWIALFFILSPSLAIGCVVMVTYSVWLPISYSVMNAMLNVDRTYIDTARTLGAVSDWKLILHVMIPLIMPGIFQGLTAGLRAACGSLVVAEMMGVDSGLAWYMTWQRGWGNFTKMYTAVIIICMTFLLVDLLLETIRRRVLKWKETV